MIRTATRLALFLIMGAVTAAPALAQKVRLATSMGDIVLQLDAEKAPKTVDNFTQYVKAGHYDGTIFHRVIDNFMIQGGGYTPDMKERATSRPAIPLESRNGLANVRGSLAMARTMVPDSARAQFYIRRINNSELANAESLWLGVRVENRLGNRDAQEQLAGQLRRRFPQSPEVGQLERGAFND